MKKSILSIFAFLASIGCYASFDFNDRCQQAHTLMMELRLSEARSLLELEKKQNPDNAIPYYVEAYVEFFDFFIKEEDVLYEERKDYFDSLLDRVDDDDADESPYYKLCLSEMYLLRSAFKIKYGHEVSAAYDTYKAYHKLEDNVKEFPTFTPNRIGMGFLHAAVGSIPDKYQFYANIAGFEGSIPKGVQYLENAYERTKTGRYAYLNTKAGFVLAFTKQQLENDEEFDLTRLDLDYQNNILLSFLQARILMHNGRNDEAIAVLKNRPTGTKYQEFFYMDYLLGKAKLNRFDKDADVYFLRFLNNFKGKNYVKSAYRYLAWHYLLNGDSEKFDTYKNYSKTKGAINSGADIEAQHIFDQPTNKVLLEARLLFDGAYYDKALVKINELKNCCATEYDKVEYNYRLARIYHRTNELKKAIDYYSLAINTNTNKSSYMAANAALNIAVIYEESGSVSDAKKYYKTCLEYYDYPYYDGINQKAKAGLSRVK